MESVVTCILKIITYYKNNANNNIIDICDALTTLNHLLGDKSRMSLMIINVLLNRYMRHWNITEITDNIEWNICDELNKAYGNHFLIHEGIRVLEFKHMLSSKRTEMMHKLCEMKVLFEKQNNIYKKYKNFYIASSNTTEKKIYKRKYQSIDNTIRILKKNIFELNDILKNT